jgi:hypothetical protein
MNLEGLIEEKAAELATRPAVDRWAACAAIWARLYVLAGPGLRRWPDIAADLSKVFVAVLRRGADIDVDPAFQIPVAIKEFHIEDDGSDEWTYMVDLIGVMTPPAEGSDVGECVDVAIQTYIDSMLNSRARAYADETGRPISMAAVNERVVSDPDWLRVLDFVKSL